MSSPSVHDQLQQRIDTSQEAINRIMMEARIARAEFVGDCLTALGRGIVRQAARTGKLLKRALPMPRHATA